MLVVSFIGFESDTTLLDGMLNDYEITLEPLITNSKEVQITAEKSAQSVGLKTLKQEFITGKLFEEVLAVLYLKHLKRMLVQKWLIVMH